MKLHILLGLFVGILIGMNLLGNKITTLAGISVSVGIFLVPLTFLITDIVEEVYGKEVVKHFIASGVLAIIAMFFFTGFFVWLEPNARFPYNAEYTIIFASSMRIMAASVVAFVLAQLHDMWSFAFWKERTRGKYLWLRNNLSTWVSQAIDTFVFMMIAFYHMTPKFTFGFIIELAIPYYLFKLAFALLDTPFVYLGVAWLRGKNNDQRISS
ncbi:transporter [Candidatus Peregrinibacteria bacterium CG10_big_fil_rev_8_21_14_0_10_55_24]|nr:MAG: transporter [Candidatus Peregrinibacteria bacterium CG10_big_fil_rev_8_21_14_0_10_55_24]